VLQVARIIRQKFRLGAFKSWFGRGRGIGLLLLLLLIGIRSWDPLAVQVLRFKTFDFYQNLQPRVVPDGGLPYCGGCRVVIVDIDEKSLKALGQWPWPRHVLADLVIKLNKLGAAVIGFDIIFPEEDRLSPHLFAKSTANLSKSTFGELSHMPGNDQIFASAIKGRRVVLSQSGINHIEKERGGLPKLISAAFIGGDPRAVIKKYPGLLRNIPVLENSADGLGIISINSELDGVVRRVPAIIAVGSKVHSALPIEMLRVAVQLSTGKRRSPIVRSIKEAATGNILVKKVQLSRNFSLPTDRRGLINIFFRPHDQDLYVSATDILSEKTPAKKISGNFVLIGTSALGLKDIRSTPLDPNIPGVEIHANVLENVLTGNQLSRLPDSTGIEILEIFLAGILLIILMPITGAYWSLIVVVSSIAILGGYTWQEYQAQELIDLSYPILSTFLIYAVLVLMNYAKTSSEKRQIRRAFSQYLSPALVKQVADEPERLQLGGEMRDMTFLFCDVRGFTTISESYKSNPQGLTRLINRLLTPMTDVILARSGTIDKYMGDCIMAFWNAPLHDPSHVKHACASALTLFHELDELNRKLEEEARAEGKEPQPIKVGVGLNTGECVVGNMGSEQRFDYSVLGDAVNLAARLEGQSKNYGVDIVIGENTYEVAKQSFATIELDLIAVKGKEEAVQIYALLGDEKQKDDASFQKLCEQHEAMLRTYRAQDWDGARRLVEDCRLLDTRLETLYEMYDERIDQYLQEPPGEDWGGVYVATTK
jgi:adenylate cyclase|tara:strand:+ start:264 stop:2561 length:2298 start_codon:yes stop_codon:yes gene_type:complete